jgi:predicted nucleic acid-binding protein
MEVKWNQWDWRDAFLFWEGEIDGEMSMRHGRHDADFRDATLADLAQLPIQIDGETDARAWGETLSLAERHRLTLYDATYLELALRRNLPLATLDEDLGSAAEKVRVVE